jgi:hypothetical protein
VRRRAAAFRPFVVGWRVGWAALGKEADVPDDRGASGRVSPMTAGQLSEYGNINANGAIVASNSLPSERTI